MRGGFYGDSAEVFGTDDFAVPRSRCAWLDVAVVCLVVDQGADFAPGLCLSEPFGAADADNDIDGLGRGHG
ncbi:hypothetical protein B2G71_19605 [Novosphingobium sp. PC22D]|nr:hypothetical protein B2G71_19605 [Novosphingobium sp. PC22D]